MAKRVCEHSGIEFEISDSSEVVALKSRILALRESLRRIKSKCDHIEMEELCDCSTGMSLTAAQAMVEDDEAQDEFNGEANRKLHFGMA